MKIFERLSTTFTCLAIAAGLVATTTVVAIAPAFAQGATTTTATTPPVANASSAASTAPPIPSTQQVLVGGILFLTVRGAWGGLSAEQRASEVQDRINKALASGPIYPSDITVAKVDGDWIVLLQGQRLFTADYDTSRIDETPPHDLAVKWANFLKATLPGLTAPTNNVPAAATTTPPAPAAAPTPAPSPTPAQ